MKVLLRFAEQQIEHPAAATMLALLPAMREDRGVAATRFFQRIGEDRHRLEAALGVDCLGKYLEFDSRTTFGLDLQDETDCRIFLEDTLRGVQALRLSNQAPSERRRMFG